MKGIDISSGFEVYRMVEAATSSRLLKKAISLPLLTRAAQ